jgi:epoxyqueuosine reductase
MLDISHIDLIEQAALDLGFSMCGVAHARTFPELANVSEWIEKGYAGDMKYLHDSRRSDPRSVMNGIGSVIVCALPYNAEYPGTLEALVGVDDASGPRGWISRYAWGHDYHEVLRGKLQLLLQRLKGQILDPFDARIYVDTGPVNERVLAKHAGLGWIGKNTLLLNEKQGSYFFLGTILTSLQLPETIGPLSMPAPDRCGTCTRCIDACPTDALVAPYVMDARRCISYLTIELRGAIPEDLRETMGSHIFGCDICQDVCPWNRQSPITTAGEFQPRSDQSGGNSLFLPALDWLVEMTEEQFRSFFRGSPMKRTKWRGLIRNVCIALGNATVADEVIRNRIVAALTRLSTNEDPVVSGSAQWALCRIQELSAGVAAV